jgi:hypothetical protein
LLLLYFLLLFLLFALFLLPALLLHGGTHVHELGIVGQYSFAVSGFLLLHLFVECLSVLLNGKLSVFVDGYLDDAVVADLLLGVVEILEVGMSEGVFYRDAVPGVEDQHLFQQVQAVLVHVREEACEGPLLDERNLVEALMRHYGLYRIDLFAGGFA